MTRTNDPTTTRSLSELVAMYYKSPEFTELNPGSKATYALTIEKILGYFGGDKDVRDLRKVDISTMRDDLASTPGMANMCVRVLSVMLSFAASQDWIAANPASGIRALKGGMHKPWTDEQIKTFKKHSIGMVRKTFFLCLYTGQRVKDVLALTWDQVDPKTQTITLTQSKSKATICIPLPKALLEEMKTWDGGTKYIVEGPDVALQSRYAEFRRRFITECDRIGVTPHPVFHGLRKNTAEMMAEAGCTESEMMALLGHKTNAMTHYYAQQANRNKLTLSAVRKMENVT